jgi:WhiB family transcriptional regulator, redox-sensing transcriptional regulator
VIKVSVLFSELLLPGWAQGSAGKIGLASVTSLTGDGDEFTLPCHSADPELFFSEESVEIAIAKSLCATCPMQRACLEGAISRAEPAGVWGGELFDNGKVIAAKRGVGRPRIHTQDDDSSFAQETASLDQAS